MNNVSRCTEISGDGGEHGKGHVIAEFDITPDLWFFDCHFPGNPIMPGCLGLDGLWQLTGFNLGWRGWQGRGYALGVGEVKLTGMVRPDRKMLTYKIDFKKAVQSRRLTMGVADGIVEADGELIFVSLPDFEALRQPLLNVMEQNDVRGTLTLNR